MLARQEKGRTILGWPCALLLMVMMVALPCAGGESASDVHGRLVVVAPAEFHSALADFVARKAARLPAELVALDDVLGSTAGVDEPERLKRFLFRRWRDNQLGYVLLVGDVDVLPVRYMVLDRVTPAAYDFAFYPSDLYYADIAKPDGSFEDWNSSRKGFHGLYFGEVRGEKNKDGPINEDRIDYLPELAVGRWPVRTAEQAALVAAKSLRYEQGLRSGRKPGHRLAALVAVQGWVDSRGLLDRVALALADRWQIEKRYYASGYPENTSPPTEDGLYRLLSSGAGLILHTGHGKPDRWEHCCTVAGLGTVKNADRLPVLVSAACSTATFAPLPPYEAYTDIYGKTHRGTDHGEVFTAPPPPPSAYQRQFNPTGLGEAALVQSENGAVAYIGCDTGSQPCALTLLEGFANALGTAAAPRLGDAWVAAVHAYYSREGLPGLRPAEDWYPPSIFFQAMKFMVFGDPSLPLPGARGAADVPGSAQESSPSRSSTCPTTSE